MNAGADRGSSEPGRVDPRLRVTRMAALVGGGLAMLAAMLLLSGFPRRRDLAWTVGLALFILAIVANRLIVRQERAAERDRRPGPGSGGGPEA